MNYCMHLEDTYTIKTWYLFSKWMLCVERDVFNLDMKMWCVLTLCKDKVHSRREYYLCLGIVHLEMHRSRNEHSLYLETRHHKIYSIRISRIGKFYISRLCISRCIVYIDLHLDMSIPYISRLCNNIYNIICIKMQTSQEANIVCASRDSCNCWYASWDEYHIWDTIYIYASGEEYNISRYNMHTSRNKYTRYAFDMNILCMHLEILLLGRYLKMRILLFLYQNVYLFRNAYLV